MIIDFNEQRQSLVFGYPVTVTDWLSALESACSNIYNYANYTLPVHLNWLIALESTCSNIYDYTNYTLPSHLSINQSYVK